MHHDDDMSRKKAPPPPTNGVKRSRDALRDDEENDEVDERATKVSHFDSKAGGAVDESNRKVEKAPLVIERQANRDWKDAANKRKRQKHGLPVVEADKTEMNGSASLPVREGAKGYGLNAGLQTGGQGGTDASAQAMDVVEQAQEVPPEPNAEASVAAKTADEEAMDALLGITKKSDLVVPAMTEEDAFQNDVTEAPDMATLEDYTRVPVEQFGAAMLRGMGWKDGDGIGLEKGKKQLKTKIPERRPALLGIGAKEEAAVAQEMGAWGKAARGKGGKEPVVYNPILLRDKNTGEMFTEEEAQKRKEKEEQEKYEMEFEKKEKERDRGKSDDRERRRRRDEDDERERRKEKDGRRDRGSERHRDRDRERRRHDDSEDEEERRRRKDRERRRYDDSEDEEERRRRKDKERRRREEDDYDRERSRRHDKDSHRRRDRSREHRRR
ncbi:hypothetical protein Q7P37_002541 [Cladosporium fusiforme]